jgi:hypothetical protein
MILSALPLTNSGDEALRDSILGGKAPAQQFAEKRAEIRETISSELLQEIFLKQSQIRFEGGRARRSASLFYTSINTFQ